VLGERAARIDHAVMGVGDLDLAVARFQDVLGLPELTRSSHPAWGTCNAVIAVGPGQFIELLAIADEASRSPLVLGLRRLVAEGDRMVGLCLRPTDLDATARRLDLQVIAGERHEPDRILTFRRTVPEDRPDMPFFIQWNGDQAALDARYADGGAEIVWAEYGGNADDLAAWIGEDGLPVRAVQGRGPCRFAVRTSNGTEVVVD
jgi:catechol 2,3-dioxygenase-like lactoylglutathione lyase family enzyme